MSKAKTATSTQSEPRMRRRSEVRCCKGSSASMASSPTSVKVEVNVGRKLDSNAVPRKWSW